MKTSVTSTSLMAYGELKEKIPTRQAQVLKTIELIGPCFDSEVSERSGLPINCVTGRRGELLKMGLIEIHGRSKNKFGRLATKWKINIQEVQKLIQSHGKS